MKACKCHITNIPQIKQINISVAYIWRRRNKEEKMALLIHIRLCHQMNLMQTYEVFLVGRNWWPTYSRDGRKLVVAGNSVGQEKQKVLVGSPEV